MYSQEELQIASTKIEQANAAITKFVENLYTNYEFDNEGRLLSSAPWTETGWNEYNLLREDSRKIRKILRKRQQNWQPHFIAPLFTYDTTTRNWYINVLDYPTIEQAKDCLLKWQITIREWITVDIKKDKS